MRENTRFNEEAVAAALDPWTLEYHDFDPEAEMLRESLCTLGNGYFCTRGAAEWAAGDGEVHYPGTYLAGGYNRLVTEIAGRDVVNEDLVNLPNWLTLAVRPASGKWLDLDELEILAYHQKLDMRTGLLHRDLTVRDHEGRETSVTSRRLVHMGDPHLAALELVVTPLNWSGRIEVNSALDGSVTNSGVARYRSLASRHLVPVDRGCVDGEFVFLTMTTSQSKLDVAQAARTRLFREEHRLEPTYEMVCRDDYVGHHLVADAHEGVALRIEKIVALYTARDRGISEPTLEACDAMTAAPSFDELARSHIRAWEMLWRRCDVNIENFALGDDYPPDATHRTVRLHIFHVLQTVSRNSVDLDVGVPARGWHGEAYRGHIFWDELFILPFLDLRLPEVTTALLRYRHRRLHRARALAAEAGYRGAMYPWQSGSNGVEETQVLHLNPKSGRWIQDASHLQRHVNAAIVYNIWRHFQVTGDYEFLHVHGAEMILEIARFWASITHYNPDRDRYEIHGVMGPDEYHEAYPDSEEPGLDNNAYTNVMAAWCAEVALQTLHQLLEDRRVELADSIGLTDDDITMWSEMRHKMFVPFHGDGIISQFEGYENLEELDWEGYRAVYGDIHRLDRILEAEGDSPNRYKLSKQADVLMLAYLLSEHELAEIFDRLGYPLDAAAWKRNYDYYCRRTAHGSTLSQVVHATLAAKLRPESFDWSLYATALRADVEDIQGGTTKEGIHLGAMAATVDVLTRRFVGLEFRDHTMVLNPPNLDPNTTLSFRIRYLNTWVDVTAASGQLTLGVRPGGADAISVEVGGRIEQIASGDTRSFEPGS